jgi:hypothetical protein
MKRMNRLMHVRACGVALMALFSSSVGALAAENDYLIITSAALKSSFQTLADHRTTFNRFKSAVVTLESIYANPNYNGIRPSGGMDNQTKIRQCIADYVRNKGTLYVCLGGDTSVVPARSFYKSDDGNRVFDGYYAGLDGTWDSNANGSYAEVADTADLAYDVWLGRITIRDAAQAMAYINKVVAYDNNPPYPIAKKMILGGNILSGMVAPSDQYAQDLCNDGFRQFKASGSGCSDAEIWLRRGYRDYVQKNGWNADTLSCWFDTLNDNSNKNSGWQFMTVFTHGNDNAWNYNSSWGGINQDTLTGPINFVYAISCITGNFNAEPSYGERYIRNPNGAALTYIGWSGHTYGGAWPTTYGGLGSGEGPSEYCNQWYKEVFGNKKQIAGQAFMDSKISIPSSGDHGNNLRLNLQGDPAIGMILQHPLLSVAATDSAAGETGPDTGTFEINRAAELCGRVTVNYSLSGTATYGVDYVTIPASSGSGTGSIVVSNGLTSATLKVVPLTDSLVEPDETVVLSITCPAGCQLSSSRATVTIRNGTPMGPAGYTWCAGENESYTFTGTYDVAYGANGVFSYLYGVTGSITFNNSTFGDPLHGVVKAGYYINAALPSPWLNQGIGAVGTAGSASYSPGGIFRVKGAGSDIGGTADSLHYAYQIMSGDGSLVARLTGMSDQALSKVGLMMRENLTPGSRHVMVLLNFGYGTAPGSVRLASRSSTGGGTTWMNGAAGMTLPRWFKLTRVGNTFTGSVSVDGQNWTTVGSRSITMASTIYMGLGVCNRNTRVLGVATLDTVTATP